MTGRYVVQYSLLKFRIENKKDWNFIFFVLVSPIFSKARSFRVHKALA